MWDLRSLIRTHGPFVGRQVLNHWTTREIPNFVFFKVNNCIYYRNIAACLDTYMSSEIIITVKLISVSYPHAELHIFCVITPAVYFLRKFPVFNTVLLTVVIFLYIRSLDLLILHNCNLVHFGQHLVFPTSLSPLTTILLSSSIYMTF